MDSSSNHTLKTLVKKTPKKNIFGISPWTLDPGPWPLLNSQPQGSPWMPQSTTASRAMEDYWHTDTGRPLPAYSSFSCMVSGHDDYRISDHHCSRRLDSFSPVRCFIGPKFSDFCTRLNCERPTATETTSNVSEAVDHSRLASVETCPSRLTSPLSSRTVECLRRHLFAAVPSFTSSVCWCVPKGQHNNLQAMVCQIMKPTYQHVLHWWQHVSCAQLIIARHTVMAAAYINKQGDSYWKWKKEVFYLTTHSTHFIFRLYGIGHMVKNHSDSERKPTAANDLVEDIEDITLVSMTDNVYDTGSA